MFMPALLLAAIATLWMPVAAGADASGGRLRILVANTVTETGILEALVARFRASRPDLEVVIIPAGALTVLERGQRGEADLLLTHHPQGEELFVNDGYGSLRTSVMYNEFAILGPSRDPLRITQERDLMVALRKLAKNQVPFMAPGLRSGTTTKLNQLWIMAGVEPAWVGYEITDTSASATLQNAALFGAYTFADLGTYLTSRKALEGSIVPLYRDHVLLRNYYSALVVRGKAVPGVNERAATAFHDFLISDEGQSLIREFGEKRFGAQLFVPAAHLDDGLRARRMQEQLDRQERNILALIGVALLLALALALALRLFVGIRRSEQSRRHSEERFELAVAGSNDGIWDWDVATDSAFFSPRLREILGIADNAERVADPRLTLLNQVHPADRSRLDTRLGYFIRGESREPLLEAEFRVERGDEPRWVLLRGKALRDEEGRAKRLSGSLSDITDRKKQAAALEHQALHDALTGLPNRRLLHDRLSHALQSARKQDGILALIVMDLDRFKDINDTLGHHTGDLLLQQVCARLVRLVRPSDTVARLGGDEFALLLPGADEVYARHVSQKVMLALNKLFEIGNHQLYVGGSLGIALYPPHGDDVPALIQHADVAMYQAKRTNSGCSVYDVQQDRHSVHRLSLEKDLREAIENDTLELHYQPKVDLRNGAMIGVEALLRWTHPQHGPVPPNELIPMSEETGLIKPLTMWVMNAALHQCSEWRRTGIDLNVAVNLSVWNLQDPSLVDSIRAALATWGVPAASLGLEITESGMMADPERALITLNALDAMGIELAVDDYGTGFSSLAYLHRLPVDSLKIDKSFVMDMTTNADNSTIVRSTIDLAHGLGVKVVAEGVETEQAYQQLRDMGCDTAQGYYIGRPKPAAAIARLFQGTAAQVVPLRPTPRSELSRP
jgi:diguanylate cyclase (GGDEF)-like protein/PAS domain S-box-containing protein